jgi:hypothetical protein
VNTRLPNISLRIFSIFNANGEPFNLLFDFLNCLKNNLHCEKIEASVSPAVHPDLLTKTALLEKSTKYSRIRPHLYCRDCMTKSRIRELSGEDDMLPVLLSCFLFSVRPLKETNVTRIVKR